MNSRYAARSLAALILLGGSVIATVAAAPESAQSVNSKPTVTQERAAEIALARVPGGKVVEAELEKEHGRQVWSFDISRPDSKDVTEIQVDAKTGEIVAEENETPDQEKNEDADRK
jgi:uncharacterized membrane protein YkoI